MQRRSEAERSAAAGSRIAAAATADDPSDLQHKGREVQNTETERKRERTKICFPVGIPVLLSSTFRKSWPQFASISALFSSDIKNFEDIKIFDKKFVNTSFKNLFEVLFFANYLSIKGLFEFLCQTIADRIKNKSVKAVRKIFNVTNDYTEEEEVKVYEKNKWAFEGERDESVD
ncbi:SKP1-like protein 3 [Nicotiana sylvestris]|uniref:SKP1-like protein 3 n=1 Tax=Nicotiana sylvestris TaxID=4096 RepID=UPI00388C5780